MLPCDAVAHGLASSAARAIVERAIAERIFPAAGVEVGGSDGVVWREAFGRLTFDDAAPAARDDTLFDLASLTKPIATTSIVLQLLTEGRLDLREPVATFFEDWRGPDREHVTVLDLLEHAGGLAARLVDRAPETRREFEHEICTMRLEYLPRTRSIYTDLGFILLAFLAADRGGAPLAEQFDRIQTRVVGPATDLLTFTVPAEARDRTAPTTPMDDDVRKGRVLVGEVHDHYAAALGGVAGHAGLFGTAAAVGRFATVALRASRGDLSLAPPLSAELMALATMRSTVPGSSRALGWDTMLPTSSCGSRMSTSAFGHVGFTGTSLWLDPMRDRYFVLLTNRAAGRGTLEQMREVRRAFHDALAWPQPVPERQ
jgi:CubicO group peptidase (beta-lactamase class C family)